MIKENGTIWWSPPGFLPEVCPDTVQQLAWHPQACLASLSMSYLSSPKRYSSVGKAFNQTCPIIALSSLRPLTYHWNPNPFLHTSSMLFFTSGFSVSPQAKIKSAPRIRMNSNSSCSPSVSSLIVYTEMNRTWAKAEQNKTSQTLQKWLIPSSIADVQQNCGIHKSFSMFFVFHLSR